MIVIVYGVTGCGKSTIGVALANTLKLPFYDGDHFHPASNKKKMNAGIPLTDEDRIPWLENLANNILDWNKKGGAVLACSALNEKYRKILKVVPDMHWVLLDGSKSLIKSRLGKRVGHFMNPALLDSQLATLEKPDYGWRISIDKKPEKIVTEILKKINTLENMSEFGIIGMGVMGKSLALNLADTNTGISIYNRHLAGKEEKIAEKVLEENPGYENMKAFDQLVPFLESLTSPKKIMLMIPAGTAVDMQVEELLPYLEAGDVLIDGGNSFYKDTTKRAAYLKEKEILFLGAGVSGGEEGARKGPAIMPGGSKEGYDLVAPFLEKIAAKDYRGKPCLTYVGPEGAGHFVKMVHNSIEYGEMQVIAEVYYLMRYYLDLAPDRIAAIFETWMEGDLSNYLLEITIDILRKEEDGGLLLDKILDQAAQKGTGGWSVNTALEYGVPYSGLTEAVMARNISSRKAFRMIASGMYGSEKLTGIEEEEAFLDKLQKAYQAARIINHETGFSLMLEVSEKNKWELNFSEIARIWTNGCIIRSFLMEELVGIFKESSRLILHDEAVRALKGYQNDLSYVVGQALQHGFAVPVLSSSINYFLSCITGYSAANLIQAQRDYFGAHTYQRTDRDPGESFHTQWKK
ncbi:NADP-dependent phosphogluconate dehydrogenase [Cyclobacterium plantarum]|uniref:6-phosphogluconate dehydrogenase, decarboxylating n=1 Tax=Cyclobacterium plantarum TaxID=2716263 RepID=A0ABX0H876_9BACT|nr:NADP-dependent phosphogluconate dehydrogenase [Cyclobacterium plantarum]NHE57580.1 NADP-dependent phosphogluconate dehydrogenase [Cyclobacterium plantarum]